MGAKQRDIKKAETLFCLFVFQYLDEKLFRAFLLHNFILNKIQCFVDQCEHGLFGAFRVTVFDGVEHFGVIFHYAIVVAFNGAGVADTDAQGG